MSARNPAYKSANDNHNIQQKIDTNEMLISTLTPGPVLSFDISAAVETISTRVAVIPPCNIPLRF